MPIHQLPEFAGLCLPICPISQFPILRRRLDIEPKPGTIDDRYMVAEETAQEERTTPDAGVRELEAHASEIIREVRESRARYVVACRGEAGGLLLPLEEVSSTSPICTGEATTSTWETLTRLGEEIGQGWQSRLTSTELLSDVRR